MIRRRRGVRSATRSTRISRKSAGSAALSVPFSSAGGFGDRPLGTISGVPETGSAMTSEARPNTSLTMASVTMSTTAPSARIAPSRMATRWVA